MQSKDIGLAVIGSGRIGTLRAKLAAGHPAVRFIAASDRDPANAKKLAETVGAQFHSSDDEADQVLRAIDKHGANVRVGYSRRYKERYLIAKEQLAQGRMGALTGGAARVFNSRAQA